MDETVTVKPPNASVQKGKIIIIIPAYNAASVLPKTIASLPEHCADETILVDDGSSDGTGEVGERLGLSVIRHRQNKGYGHAQKTGYKEAIIRGAGVIVMVHGDNQYDPSLVNTFVRKITDESYDVVTGTRMVRGDALRSGMPIWKYIPNRILTALENIAFKTSLSDYHNGYRAYSADFLKKVPLDLLSDKYDFDTDIIVQAAIRGCRITEIPHKTRYLSENRQISFVQGVVYGLSILKTIGKFLLHRFGIYRQEVFDCRRN